MPREGAGHRAWETRRLNNARAIAALARDSYRNPAKDRIRSWVIAELKASSPSLVLDLWGGGASADEMTAAGLTVLSAEDGRGFEDYGVSKQRVRTALLCIAPIDGYRAVWGSAGRHAAQCDAGWLDFMGHLSGDAVRVLSHCRHMQVLAVTLMPDRMAGVQRLSVETWVAMYRAAVEMHSGLKVRQVRKYRRDKGQWVVVLVARRQGFDRRAWDRERYTDPERRAKQAEYLREYRAKNKDRLKAGFAARWADPEVRATHYALKRARYANDPEYRARILAKQQAYRLRRKAQASSSD